MITGITISQTNITETCNLLAIHSPLIFFADVDYSGDAPLSLTVEIWDEVNKLGEFNCIPHEFLSSNVRRFFFKADGILKGFMDSYNDYPANEMICEKVNNITKEFTLKFVDGSIVSEVSFVAAHSARQFGEDSLMTDIADNSDEMFIGAFGLPVYAYFYNDDPTAVITVGQTVLEGVIAVDDDQAYFTDADGTVFTILVDTTQVTEPEPEPEPIQPQMVVSYKFAMTANAELGILPLDGNYALSINHGKNTLKVSPVWVDENGYIRELSDIFQIVDGNNIILYCNNAITGVHTLTLTFN